MAKLAHIDELAKQAIPNVHMTTQHVCLTVSELEQLRQAIIRDFVSTVEPVAWATKASITNAISGNDVIVGKKVKQGRTIEVLRDIAIYDLSEWSNK